MGRRVRGDGDDADAGAGDVGRAAARRGIVGRSCLVVVVVVVGGVGGSGGSLRIGVGDG